MVDLTENLPEDLWLAGLGRHYPLPMRLPSEEFVARVHAEHWRRYQDGITAVLRAVDPVHRKRAWERLHDQGWCAACLGKTRPGADWTTRRVRTDRLKIWPAGWPHLGAIVLAANLIAFVIAALRAG